MKTKKYACSRVQNNEHCEHKSEHCLFMWSTDLIFLIRYLEMLTGMEKIIWKHIQEVYINTVMALRLNRT